MKRKYVDGIDFCFFKKGTGIIGGFKGNMYNYLEPIEAPLTTFPFVLYILIFKAR